LSYRDWRDGLLPHPETGELHPAYALYCGSCRKSHKVGDFYIPEGTPWLCDACHSGERQVYERRGIRLYQHSDGRIVNHPEGSSV
jgi:hypothetical protein